jgi:hypothetical protein
MPTNTHRLPLLCAETLEELTFLFDHLGKYFSCKIIRTAPLDPAGTYMFGYHPHGVAPLTLLWLTLTSTWRALFPGVIVNPCSARYDRGRFLTPVLLVMHW